MTGTRRRKRALSFLTPQRIAGWFAALVLLAGLVFIALEWPRFRLVLAQTNWRLVPLALATTALSYLCISLSFTRVSRLFGVEMNRRDLMGVGFVSVVMNHIVSTAGAGGYSVRYNLMGPHGVRFGRIMAVSILHFVLTSMVMIGILPLGLAYLITYGAVSGGTATILAGLVAVAILVDGLGVAVVFWSKFRSWFFGVAQHVIQARFRRDVGTTLRAFDATMTEGTRAMRRHLIGSFWLMMLILIDWIASATTLWFAFRSLGVIATPGMVTSGFVIGTVAGVASMIPGGLGVQEGSMAGVLTLLGLGFDSSVLAAILYRIIYFVIPYLVAFFLYQLLLRRTKRTPSIAESELEHAHIDA